MSLVQARILLVEDHLPLAENVIEILEDVGATVVHAATGAEAQAAAVAQFDVALVDVSLPDSTGLELLRELRGSGDGLMEVLLVTGNATLQDAIEAVTGGAYAYLLKPFEGDQLISSIERALRQVRSSRHARELSAELERRETKLRTLVETVQALLLVIDANGIVVQANSATAALTGYPIEQIIGGPWVERFVHVDDLPGVERVFDRLAGGEADVSHENRILGRLPNGATTEHVVRWRSSPLRAEDGSLHVYASGLDVTAVRTLERRAQLTEKLAAVGTLTAGLAHEIRNPLNSAKLQLNLLERRLSKVSQDPKLHEPIGLVLHEIDRLSALLQEFLEFARPSAASAAETDVGELVSQVAQLEGTVAAMRGIDIDVHCEPGVLATVDANKMRQVLLNLFKNAIEAIGTNGNIKATVDSDARGARIVIRDNGPGVPPDVMARMFEPFFSTKEMGTGLGMAICHSLIEQHGGTISVRNDGGAVFEVRLPRR